MKAKVLANSTKKRDLFDELGQGIAALVEAREGKRTLRTHAVEYKPAPKQLIRVREQLNLSGAVCRVLTYQCLDFGKLGTRPRQAQCAGSVADQSGQAISRHRAAASFNLSYPCLACGGESAADTRRRRESCDGHFARCIENAK